MNFLTKNKGSHSVQSRGGHGAIGPFSSDGSLVKLERAIFYIMWMGKYWAVFYFHLK